MGLIKGPVEVYDAEKNQLRVELTGSGEVVEFARMESLNYAGRQFAKIGQ